jgi:hypothetical protein
MSPQDTLTRSNIPTANHSWFAPRVSETIWDTVSQIVGLERYHETWDIFAIETLQNDPKIQLILTWLSHGIKEIATSLWVTSMGLHITLKKFWPREAVIGCEISKDGVINTKASDILRIVIRKRWNHYFWPHLAENALELPPEIFVWRYLQAYRKIIEKGVSHLKHH